MMNRCGFAAAVFLHDREKPVDYLLKKYDELCNDQPTNEPGGKNRESV